MSVDAVLQWLEDNEAAGLDRLKDWLAIPSVGADPAFDADTRRAAEWCAAHLSESGFDVSLMETADASKGERGQPIVLATCGDDSTPGPHILFYGHYDVQPADPLDLWETGPFEPVRKPADADGGDRIVARGASDDKGQVAMFLEAMRAWKEAGGLTGGGVRITALIEGEEESGSVNLERFLEREKDRLAACDVCVISDTGMLARGKPAITYGVRGLTYTEVTLHGPSRDLHSGMWGGRCPNPINELVRVLGQIWDAQRRVTIPGFYDGVNGPVAAEREQWRGLGRDAVAQLKDIGLPPEADVGEAGFSEVEREWARPTCDINGIVGGYTGAGAKTVIPSHASAKISFRLVDEQNPDAIRDAFFAWLRDRTPPGCRWELVDHGGGKPATVAVESPYLTAAGRAIERACGTPPAMIKTGGSIPVAGQLKKMLGLETVFMGFGLDDDRVHSPNEKFEVECFRMGAKSHVVLCEELRQLT
jgi:acetylornithine deacetylase/succinyl-diaminopimelate desuccinylase-like protein